MNIFMPADIMIPQVESLEKWSVIACDQFTSQPEYWEKVSQYVGNAPSALNIVFPEVELGNEDERKIEDINKTMLDYINKGIFQTYGKAFVYVERTLLNGSVRRGLVGQIDLEAYDYSPNAKAEIRASEKTVVERIPTRVNIRAKAVLEIPHVLLLCDDEEKSIIEPISEIKTKLKKLYEFDLMESGGHIVGWLIDGKVLDAVLERIERYTIKKREYYLAQNMDPLYYVVGDGNHSLAAAKVCYERMKLEHPEEDSFNYPDRYALVELENLHDDVQVFEPIHRIIKNVDTDRLLMELQNQISGEGGGIIQWFSQEKSGVLKLNRKSGVLPIGVIQNFLDDYVRTHSGEMDYIHGEDALKALAEEQDVIGFLLPKIEKNQVFASVVAEGVLPRKTFSMGHAQEKRYYLEARRIGQNYERKRS